MNSFLESMEQYRRKGRYELLLMRSWRNQELKSIHKSVTCYGVLQSTLDGTSLTIKCPKKALEAVRAYLRSCLLRLSKSSLTVQEKKQLQDLILIIGKIRGIDDVDRLVERALEASQEQKKP